MHSFPSGGHPEEHHCSEQRGDMGTTQLWVLRAGCCIPAQRSGQLCNLHCMGGLCRLSSQWLILAYSCPWWYVKYSVASLFLSFLWSWCRNVSGLGAPCLRAEPGPPLPVLHQKWNFTPNLKRAFCSLSRTGWAEGQQSFVGERHRAGGAPSASAECEYHQLCQDW